MIGDGCVKKGQGKGTNASDSSRFFALLKARPTKLFAYGFIMAFVGCTAFLAFNPSGNGSPWFNSLFTSYSFSSSIAPYRSHFNNLISRFFPNSTSSLIDDKPFGNGEFGSRKGAVFLAAPPASVGSVTKLEQNGAVSKNRTEAKPVSKKDESFSNKSANGVNRTAEGVTSLGSMIQASRSNSIGNELGSSAKDGSFEKKPPLNQTGQNQTAIKVPGKNLSGTELEQEKRVPESNSLGKELPSKGITATVPKESKSENVTSVGSGNQSSRKKMSPSPVQSKEQTATEVRDQTKSPAAFIEHPASSKEKKVPAAQTLNDSGKMTADWIKGMASCDIFHGKWVKDDSYPLYSEGSCPHIDEPFDCFLNGRPDRAYQKFRWQPDGCKVPRFNALDLLERLRGKRLVFVGDSLNRNMWESLVCALKDSVKNKKKVFEASGRHKFRTEGSYSFLFKDYNCTVEFFRSPFLVQEWEVPDSNGKKKETLRLDIIERSSSRYKDANILVFNTGHWWTHEKTSKGRDYYQEGNRVYSELNVVEAFHKALHTWAKWVDANVNPNKTFIIFRGYSASHFRGGQWNSGGACDRETEPIMNEKYLSPYPPKMRVLETVLNGMKTPVSYLNITRMTDFRKDAHPSIYRKQNLTDEESREPERFQDCSHWCLPGVPDSWNELLYAQILIRQHQTPNW